MDKRKAELKKARKEHGCEGFLIARTADMKVELRFPFQLQRVKFDPAQAVIAARAILDTALETGYERPDWYVPQSPAAGPAAHQERDHGKQEASSKEEAEG